MKRLWRETLWVRFWALRNVFLLRFVKPSIVDLSDERCEVVIPLNWRTRRRDIHAMYLGVLVMGADVAGGLIAFNLIMRSKQPVSFLFKDVKGEFFKRAEDDVHFVCTEGLAIRDLVGRAMASGEREELTVNVAATVPSKLGEEPVARFALTLSVKKRT
ncbi:MAG TPA: DUF4442 domain-containing protein [Thermoanaerobaculia bacterium]|nr:DUF4442 domain-containing protein [Thermoanaerobaculia bacterium]